VASLAQGSVVSDGQLMHKFIDIQWLLFILVSFLRWG
jgi:hypothetical protein